MGKDKKEKNPADAFRKEQRKKELLKLKKDREVVREVRDLLNDPKKIDEEIAKAQKISDENKLDKSLKDRIKELQRMKDVANTRQLVLAAQGKKSLAEVEGITKPSIYQNNNGVWDDSSASKSAPGGHPHVKSASRVSTEGLPTYSRGGDVPLASQMPIPTSVMLPYPPALVPNVFPRGPVMGGMGGIPLPPPRPSGPGAPFGAQVPPHMVNSAMAGHMMPPPPRGPPGSQLPMAYIPPPPHPYGMPMQGYPPPMGGPGMMQGYQHPGQYGAPPQQPHGQGAPRPWQPPAQRKPRPVKHQQEEVDPLDPAGQGYTERFGAANPPKRPPQAQAPKPPAHESSERIGLMPQDATSPPAGSAAPPPPPAPVVHRAENGSSAPIVSQSNAAAAPVPPPPPPQAAAHSFGPVLSAEDLMRRRLQVPSSGITENAEVNNTNSTSSVPPAGPMMNFGAVLSAEELMRRRHQVATEAAQGHGSDNLSGPSVGPAFPPPGASLPSYDTTLTADELMRRRYQIPDEDEDGCNEEDASVEDSEQQSADTPSAAPAQNNYSAALSAEELMRRRYEIPDVVVEDVDSDNGESDNEGAHAYQYGHGDAEEDQPGDVSEDEVRSAGMADTADFDDSEFPYQQDEDDDLPGGALELNVNNLYPARLPASFTALPQPVRPPPSVAAAYPAQKAGYSAISFNDYGDDDEDEQENEEDYYEEPAPKILPYAQPSTTTAVLPSSSSAQSASTGPDSYAPHPYPGSDVSRTVVKGPKIVKTDRALTAFVPNALKKKRMLSSTTAGSAPWQSVKVAKVSAPEHNADAAVAEEGDESDGDVRYPQSVRSEDLHAATSALLRGTSISSAAPVIKMGYVANRSTVAPIAFVAASTNSAAAARPAPTVHVPAPVPSAEEDAFAQFFQEINQL